MLTRLLRRSLLLVLVAGAALQPGSEGWSGLVQQGDRLASEHRLGSSLDCYARAAAMAGSFPLTELRRGAVYLRRGQPREAADAFRSVEARKLGGREALLGLAEASQGLGDSPAALKVLRRMLDLDPGDLEAWSRLVEGAARTGSRPAEVRVMLAGVPIPGGEGIWGQRADYLLAAGWLDPGDPGATAALRRAISGPDETLQGMAGELLAAAGEAAPAARATEEARALLLQGLVGPALARLDELPAEPPSAAAIWALRGYAYRLLEQPDRAEQAARRSVEMEPGNPVGSFVLGSVLVGRGDPEGAVAVLRPSLDRAPRNAGLYLEMGRALTALGDYGDAQKALDLAVQASPESAEVRLAAARFYVDQQYRVEIGLAEAREAERLNGGGAEARGAVAWALHLLGRTDEALAPARAAVAGAPESPLLRYRLGSIYQSLGQRDRAAEQYRMVAELDGAGDLRSRTEAALEELRPGPDGRP